jgi:hypothetical protein
MKTIEYPVIYGISPADYWQLAAFYAENCNGCAPCVFTSDARSITINGVTFVLDHDAKTEGIRSILDKTEFRFAHVRVPLAWIK